MQILKLNLLFILLLIVGGLLFEVLQLIISDLNIVVLFESLLCFLCLFIFVAGYLHKLFIISSKSVSFKLKYKKLLVKKFIDLNSKNYYFIFFSFYLFYIIWFNSLKNIKNVLIYLNKILSFLYYFNFLINISKFVEIYKKNTNKKNLIK